MNSNKPLTCIFSILFSIVIFVSLPSLITASSSVTAVFAFGDSTIDAGNNNGLPTLFRSDHAPYGKDFPNQLATGRFSNGKLSTDFMVSSLGLKDQLPAYFNPNITDSDLLTGVTFASAGCGLDDITVNLAEVFSMSRQLDYFDEAVMRIMKLVGEEKGKIIVENSIYVISVGTNDMVDNFYELPTRRLQFSLSDYQDFLLHQLESVVQRLYKAGGRKFIFVGLPPIGCLPVQVTLGSIVPSGHMFQRVCVEQQNTDSIAYNMKLQTLATGLETSNDLKGAKVAYLNVYDSMMDMINNPAKYGLTRTLEGCCGSGVVEMGPLCNSMEAICGDASKYMFWDAVHPTQPAYYVISQLAIQTVFPHLLA
ncbi:GDSL esterase/lipase At2g40250-like [Mercurialis annua]|uniref:GDSL esterase/lipase At2g40250-like n=1 Tax=Mercurialis annua TaxID=3986 RepID=UPI00215F588F|nr:GDSL esterase/lipase At2g40250-like [Mercurialis annua]